MQNTEKNVYRMFWLKTVNHGKRQEYKNDDVEVLSWKRTRRILHGNGVIDFVKNKVLEYSLDI